MGLQYTPKPWPNPDHDIGFRELRFGAIRAAFWIRFQGLGSVLRV